MKSTVIIDNGESEYGNVSIKGNLTFYTPSDVVIYEDGFTEKDLVTEKQITILKGISTIGGDVIASKSVNHLKVLYIERSVFIGGEILGFYKVEYFGDESGLSDISKLKIK